MRAAHRAQGAPSRKTPGVTRLAAILVERGFLPPPPKEHVMPTPAQLIAAAANYAARPPEDEAEVTQPSGAHRASAPTPSAPRRPR